MRRAALLILLTLSLASLLYAAAQDRVAVLDFRNPAGLDQQEVDYITELVRTEARKMLPRDQYVLMTKENIYDLLPPDKRNLAQCEGKCEVETGKMIGARYLATGEVVRFGGELRVTVRLYDVATGNLLESRKAKGKKVLDLEAPLERISSVVFAVLPGAHHQIASTPSPTPEPVYSPTPELFSPPAIADPAFEKLAKEEQVRIEAERSLARVRKRQIEADYQAVKAIHDSAAYSEAAKKAAYSKFLEKWPDDPTYTSGLKRWLLGFSSNGLTWTDTTTGLMWQVTPKARTMSWRSAKGHCANQKTGAYSDWRLPTISELRTLIRGCDPTESRGSCSVSDNCLSSTCQNNSCTVCPGGGGPLNGGGYWPKQLQGDYRIGEYWSSSPVESHKSLGWFVNFFHGHIGNQYSTVVKVGYVRCVR
jgi:Protein of unknown function (DUF1566)